MIKKIFFLVVVLLASSASLIRSQNVSISTDGASPDASAMLDIQSGTMGLSIPNVALTGLGSSSPIATTPKTGLIIYNTATAGTSPNNVVPGYYYWNGSKWVAFSGNGSTNWSLSGNAGTTAGTNFIGTTDAVDFVTKANNTELIRASSTGNVGINNASPAAKLDVAAGTTTVNTVVNSTGSINDFLQFNVQNTSSGTHAQSGYSSTADNGSATTGFAWMGINNSNFNYPTTYNIGGNNDVSFLGSGQDMYLANANNSKSIIFSTGKSTTPFFNECMRITNAGNVGINNASPVSKLDVAAGTTTVNTVVNSTGSINDFLQFNVQNTSTGTNAQSGYSATADNGTSTTGFVWMGINNSNFNYPTAYNIGGNNDVSFLGSGQDMYVANANNTKSIIFSTGKSTTPYFNERMRITNAGNVGIGTNAIPKGSIGSAKLAMDGTDQSTSGPHVQYSTSADNYPVFQQLNWSHNNVALSFDSYWDGTWKCGTSAGGCFQIYKIAGALVFNSSSTSTQGNSAGFTTAMAISQSGYVGIGTSSPSYPLDVQTTLSSAISNYGYLNSGGSTGYISGSSGTVPFSARYIGRIICPEFNAQSDARIKDIIGVSNSLKDLAILNSIKITDYEMKDKVLWGNKKFKKIIAQELEKVYPQIVNTSIGFIPNVYQGAELKSIESGYLLTFQEAIHISAEAKKIRIITQEGNLDLEIEKMPDPKTLVLRKNNQKLNAENHVFVYGEEIADFRVVDYEGLTTLNISATQQLYKMILSQNEEIIALKKENLDLKTNIHNEVQSLKAEVNALLNPVSKK